MLNLVDEIDHLNGETSSLLVVGVADGGLVEREELAQLAQGEVPLHVLLLIHHTAAQRLLVGLPLQDLLLDGPRLHVQDNTPTIRFHFGFYTVFFYTII